MSEIENVIDIIGAHIKFIEKQQLRNNKAATEWSPILLNPTNSSYWVIDKL